MYLNYSNLNKFYTFSKDIKPYILELIPEYIEFELINNKPEIKVEWLTLLANKLLFLVHERMISKEELDELLLRIASLVKVIEVTIRELYRLYQIEQYFLSKDVDLDILNQTFSSCQVLQTPGLTDTTILRDLTLHILGLDPSVNFLKLQIQQKSKTLH